MASGVLYGSSVVPPYATFYISPFIVVQLTLNLTINPKPLTDPQVILFSLDAYLCTRACSRHMTLYGYKCQLVRVSGLGQRCSPCRASAGKWNSLSDINILHIDWGIESQYVMITIGSHCKGMLGFDCLSKEARPVGRRPPSEWNQSPHLPFQEVLLQF